MAEPQLIDRYLVTLRRSLGKAPDAEDILAEVEDHLREAAAGHRHGGLDAQAAEARTLKAFGSPRLVTRAFADARKRGLAVPTTFTRRTGLAAIACPLLLLLGMLLEEAERWTIATWSSNWYLAGNLATLFAMAIVRARLLSRVAAALLGSGLLGTAGLALGQHLGGEDANVMVWPYALIGIASFRIGLTWLGWQLRVERPVDTSKGMAPSA